MGSFLEFTQTWQNNITQYICCSAVRSVWPLEIIADDPTTYNGKAKGRRLSGHGLDELPDNRLKPEEEQILFEGWYSASEDGIGALHIEHTPIAHTTGNVLMG